MTRWMLGMALSLLAFPALGQEFIPDDNEVCRKMLMLFSEELPEMTPELLEEAKAECVKVLQSLTADQRRTAAICVRDAHTSADLDKCDVESGSGGSTVQTRPMQTGPGQTPGTQATTSITAEEACHRIEELMKAMGSDVSGTDMADLMKQCLSEFGGYPAATKAQVFPCIMKAQKLEDALLCEPK